MSYPAGATYTLSSDGAAIVLTAQWNANATDDYSFNTVGGSPTPSSGSGLDGTTITLPGAPTRAGYSFNGWSDGTLSYPAGATYTLSSDGAAIVLTAQWNANATDDYSFNTVGGSPTPSSGSGLDGTTITLPGAPTRAGYSFNGWNDGTLSYPAGATYTLSSDGAAIVLTAQWNANATITITFNSEGGSVVSAVTGLEGTTITLPAAPTYTGYTFNGWFTAPSGGTALTSPYTLTASTTLYAQWNANATDDYSFNTAGGSPTPSSGSGLDGTTITLPGACRRGRLQLQRVERRHLELPGRGHLHPLERRRGHRLDRPVERQRHR